MSEVRSLRLLVLALVLPILGGCSASYRRELSFDPSEPLRVAVLPFYQLDDTGMVLTERSDVYLIDHIPGVSRTAEESPAAFVQGLFETELRQSGFDLVPRGAVEAALLHGGFRSSAGIDLASMLKARPDDLCRTIQCDALLYGRVTKWDRSYYVLQSVNTVGLDVRLVRAVDGLTLFEAMSEDSESRGLSKGPTGYTSLVLEPIRGLDTDIIVELASNVVAATVEPLRRHREDAAAEVSPPLIYASSHDAADGRIAPDARLVVLAFGTPQASAAFSIGDRILDVPMFETLPGHYVGEFYPLAGDTFHDQEVVVSLRDKFGRSIEQRATRRTVSLRDSQGPQPSSAEAAVGSPGSRGPS